MRASRPGEEEDSEAVAVGRVRVPGAADPVVAADLVVQAVEVQAAEAERAAQAVGRVRVPGVADPVVQVVEV